MAKEIERKFLVVGDSYRREASSEMMIEQGYISAYPSPTVRVRVIDRTTARLTVKGANHGIVRDEWEFDIDVADALEMLDKLPVKSLIRKTRYIVGPWEVDEFHGKLEGLVLAEIELDSADSPVPEASFIGREVSDDERYYNSSLGSASSLPPLF